MPELPEVECFARALTKNYGGKRIMNVGIRREDIRDPLDRSTILATLAPGARFFGATRDGKRLVLSTNKGKLLVSLGMSGAFLPANPKEPRKHEHLTICFSDGSAVGYVDPRRFGNIEPYLQPLKHLSDPMNSSSLLRLFENPRVRQSTRSVRDILMDQKLIGGLGNIYALEALHIAGIRPSRRMRLISKTAWERLARIIPDLLRRAIRLCGSSIATYRTLHGEKGGFQKFHRAYRRDGLRCLRKGCHGYIVRKTIGGRPIFYCPNCQT